MELIKWGGNLMLFIQEQIDKRNEWKKRRWVQMVIRINVKITRKHFECDCERMSQKRENHKTERKRKEKNKEGKKRN